MGMIDGFGLWNNPVLVWLRGYSCIIGRNGFYVGSSIHQSSKLG
jgi:hypothetical protein